ncbi:hypothetical protein [Pseudoteredinibacter isoporae]|uniref:hypothetical protein n=1 Tax=Pseudoteredinibacter isoporae TaxID=570281 RepID=UPI00310515B6
MPISGSAQREFLLYILKQKTLTLTEVEHFFYPEDKSNTKALGDLLRHLKNSNFLSVQDDNGQDIKIQQEMFNSPQPYSVVVSDIREYELEQVNSAYFTWKAEDISQIDESVHMCFLNGHPFQIYGDVEGCKPQMARLRSFTNLFAQLLITRRFTELATYIHPAVGDEYDTPALEAMFVDSETKNGKIDTFDDISIDEIYWGKGSEKKFFDDEGIPKGVKRKDRVGKSSFQLQCGLSPNGIGSWEYTVSIWVSETPEGIMWVYKVDMYSSY